MTTSFRLEVLVNLAREAGVVENVEQVRSLDATALGETAAHGTLKVVVRPVVEERALERWWDLQDRGWRILVVR